jgi:ribosome-binding protein aMBF1 (putative translation factor)
LAAVVIRNRRMTPDQRTFAERFGRHVRALRTRAGLSRIEVAEKCGLSAGFIRDVEIGDRRCMIDVAMKLATTLKVSMTELCDIKKSDHLPEPNPKPGRPRKTPDDTADE